MRFVNAADDMDGMDQSADEYNNSLLTNRIPVLSDTNKDNAAQHGTGLMSNMIENNSEISTNNKAALTMDSKGEDGILNEQYNNGESKISKWDNVFDDKPVAMMLTNRRKPLAYNGLDFGNFDVVFIV